MAIKKADKIKAIQAAFKNHEELKEVTIGKMTQPQAEMVEQLVADVLFSLAQEDKVKFADLGDFEVKATAERPGVNPAKLKELKAQGVDEATAKEQAAITIAAGKKLGFSASATVKNELKA